MNNEHITRFGDPTSITGARYVVNDQEGLLQMALELEQARLIVSDITPTDTLRNLATERVKRNLGILKSKLYSKGIPSTLTHLLNISKKTEAEKYTKTIILEEFEVFLLMHNCQQMGFSHRSTFPEYKPDHLRISKSDIDNLMKHHFQSFNKKIIPLMRERRKIHAHLLEKDLEWHCFYFSYNEIELAKTNHFKYGPHIHYVNHLWTYDKDETWHRFGTRFTKIKDAAHIRFRPFEYPQILPIERSSRTANNPLLFAIDTDLPADGNFRPIALAQIITRGSLTSDISIDPKSKKQFIQAQHTNKDIITS